MYIRCILVAFCTFNSTEIGDYLATRKSRAARLWLEARTTVAASKNSYYKEVSFNTDEQVLFAVNFLVTGLAQWQLVRFSFFKLFSNGFNPMNSFFPLLSLATLNR